jgi:alkanesulfonate monooxygenase SsuD/methylene tetrahydromethanopterin reductase-like flavin-dependent oxidoreductase (luciferase family)
MAFSRHGLFLEHAGIPHVEAIEAAVGAEDAGFGMVVMGDGFAEHFSLMGALAMRTRRAELVSGIVNWTRTPVTTALGAATMASLAPGRYRLGLGAMARTWSEDWHEIDAARPVARMRDYIAAIRSALSARPDSPATYEGSYYRHRNYMPLGGVPDSPIPIQLGATRPHMVELGAELCNGLVLHSMLTVERLRTSVTDAINAGLRRSGRSREEIDVGMHFYSAVADDEEAAFAMLRPTLALHMLAYTDVLQEEGFAAEMERLSRAAARGDREAMLAAVSDELIDNVAVAGTARQVKTKLRRYEELIDWPVFMPPADLDPEPSRAQVERMIAELAPSVT